MSKKRHLLRFGDEEIRKYDVSNYENKSYESFLDRNVEETRGNEELLCQKEKQKLISLDLELL